MWSWRRSLEYCYIQEINIGSTPWLLSGERGQCRLLACADLEFRSWINLCLISLLLTDRANRTSVVSFLFVRLGHWPFFPFFFFFRMIFSSCYFHVGLKKISSLQLIGWRLLTFGRERKKSMMVWFIFHA